MSEREFEGTLKEKTEQLEAVLKKNLPQEKGYQKTVIEAMNYSLLAGGKRLRPMLLQETYRMCGGSGEVVEPFLAAIEMIHTYSLVHDDLPAMDNDEYRRGRETTWRVYGDAMGILAGDGLLNYAFETALKAFGICGSDAALMQRVSLALFTLARKSGIHGMIGGQAADIEAEGSETPITQEQLVFIHENKTAALIQGAMMAGAILAGASEGQVKQIEKCAYNIGIAFQIQDDILDVTGDSRELGKTVGSDAQNHKQTYVTLNGLEQSAEDVKRLSEEAVSILQSFGDSGGFLIQLTEYLVHRRK